MAKISSWAGNEKAAPNWPAPLHKIHDDRADSGTAARSSGRDLFEAAAASHAGQLCSGAKDRADADTDEFRQGYQSSRRNT